MQYYEGGIISMENKNDEKIKLYFRSSELVGELILQLKKKGIDLKI